MSEKVTTGNSVGKSRMKLLLPWDLKLMVLSYSQRTHTGIQSHTYGLTIDDLGIHTDARVVNDHFIVKKKQDPNVTSRSVEFFLSTVNFRQFPAHLPSICLYYQYYIFKKTFWETFYFISTVTFLAIKRVLMETRLYLTRRCRKNSVCHHFLTYPTRCEQCVRDWGTLILPT